MENVRDQLFELGQTNEALLRTLGSILKALADRQLMSNVDVRDILDSGAMHLPPQHPILPAFERLKHRFP